MKKFTILLSLLFAMSLQMTAQIRGNNITVTVTPEHKDWNYKVGETATFTVCVLKSGTLLENSSISYELGPEMYPNIKKDITLKDGTTKVSGKMAKPGFLRLKVTAHVAGKDYQGMCTAAFSPEKIVPYAQEPKDFDEFWSKTLEQARWTSLEPKLEFLPDRSTKDVNTYHVSFQNDKWDKRVYGILCVPTKEGSYPAILRVPGAGVRPYTGDPWMAAKGIIVLEVGIHGIPVTKEQAYYDNLFSSALADYWNNNTNNRDRNYYKHVVTGCIRAIDYIATLKDWDGKNLCVTGSSQGGFLSLACAALDKRVSCYGAVHSAMCDYEAALHKVACGWPHYFYNYANPDETIEADPAEVRNARYYDGVNFAKRITCPGWFSFGYNDDVVPPTTAYGTYNVVKAPKELSPYQQTGHYWYQEQWDEWQAWILKQLGVGN